MEDPTSEGQSCEGASYMGRHSMVPNYNEAEAAKARGEAAYCEQDCLNMFMRAWHGDPNAQEWFQRHFRGVLRDWFMRHPGREAACRLHREEYYIDRAFQCAWQIPLNSPPFEFNTLATVLRCLCANLQGLMLDALRNPVPAKMTCVQVSDSTEVLSSQTETQKLWSNVQASLSNERERRLANLLFSCGLKPKDIVDTFPQEFSDVREISRLRLSVMELICDIQQIQ